jgi:predicted glycosyltransferase
VAVRLLVYSQDGKGLGHLRRTGNIAERVLARVPDANVLTVADSRATPVVPPLPGMDYLKLPTILKTGRSSSAPSSWETATLPLPIRETLRLRQTLLLHTLEEFQPDVVLVDHMPVGALGELKPLLERASRLASRPRLYLGLRDVLDAPDVIRRAWRDLGAYDFLSAYDGVLVYGCRNVYDAELAYELGPYTRKVVFCNYVGPPRRTLEAVPSETIADEERPFILVMGGGGGDAHPVAAAFLDALPQVLKSCPLEAIVLTGPSMGARERRDLEERCDGPSVRIEKSRDDVPWLLRKARAVVTMAGYNSLCEVLDAQQNALVVPRGGPSAEQRIRSRLFSERGLVRVLDPDELTAERLSDELIGMLQNGESAPLREWLPLDGGERAAELLLEGLSTRRDPLRTVARDEVATPPESLWSQRRS